MHSNIQQQQQHIPINNSKQNEQQTIKTTHTILSVSGSYSIFGPFNQPTTDTRKLLATLHPHTYSISLPTSLRLSPYVGR